MITSRGQTRQVLLSEPNVSFFPLTPAQSVILPAHARSLSFYCLHIHYSLSLSLKVSLCHQHADVLSLVFVSYATDSFESLEIFSNPVRLSRGTSVRVTCNRHQSQYHSEDVRRGTESICLATAFKRVTVQEMEPESNKVTLPLT